MVIWYTTLMQVLNHLKKIFIFLSLFSLLTLFAWGQTPKKPKINLEHSLYWAKCTADSSIENVENEFGDSFQKLNIQGPQNLSKLVGKDGSYIWVKASFTIPDELKNENLYLFARYIHFADKVWINGHYAGSYGNFPPNELSVMYKAHTYQLPEEFINQDGENTLYIKIWCHGQSEISKKIFIGTETSVKQRETSDTFYNSIVYIMYEGLFFTAFLIYSILFRQQKKKEYLSFSMICLFSLQFIFILFAPHFPAYAYVQNSTQFLIFIKYFACICSYLIIYFTVSFFIYFLVHEQKKLITIIRVSLLAIQFFITVFVPTYSSLLKVLPFLLSLGAIQFIFALYYIIKAIGSKNMEVNLVFAGVGILAASVAIEHLVKYVFHISTYIHITFYGWVTFNVFYIIVLWSRLSKIVKQNKFLTANLQKAVDEQTIQIRTTNEKLEEELDVRKKDMEMASIVQQRLFSAPRRSFIGWDFAITYDPLEEVSGDLFDFFNLGDKLNGISIFDVSGHGVSASLITMMSKSIIFQLFKNNIFGNDTMSSVMRKINNVITVEKGNVQNYLTGVICKFEDFDTNGNCKVQLANAGHPYPIMYSSKTDEMIELKHPEGTENYGAIGLTGLEVSYIDVDFEMCPGDIIVFYTDGLSEAQDIMGKQFGKANIKNVIKENKTKTADEILKALKQSLETHTKDQPRTDDVTIIVLKREKPEDFIETICDE